MSKRIACYILQLLCPHEWIKGELLEEYIDYSCFEVGVFECKCPKCGKVKNRKYIRWE